MILNSVRGISKTSKRSSDLLALLMIAMLSACGSNDSPGTSSICNFSISDEPQALSASDVEQVLAQGVEAANNLGVKATFAVVDRVGNVLGVYTMNGAIPTVTIGTLVNQPAQALEGLNGIIGSDIASISKAITGAYLSSSGNAFSSRTASYIVQNHFAPGVINTASGPLFGVQFSQLPCGDLVTRANMGTAGPHRSPLGLSADPGGLPLYKGGRVVGGIGVLADGNYGSDKTPATGSSSLDEIIAQSALHGFDAPDCIRGERISAGGLTLPYSNSDGALVPVTVTTLSDPKIAGLGGLTSVTAYYNNSSILAGTAYGTAPSGYAPDTGNFQPLNGFVLVNANNASNRYPPTASPLGGAELTAAEVQEILTQALGVANAARAQIRYPEGVAAEVTISVVDSAGNILGIVRSHDAPIFGTDVSLQKARTSTFFSSTQAASLIAAQAPISYLGGQGFPPSPPFTLDAEYLSGPTGAKIFFNNPAIFSNGIAFSPRSIANIARPNFPDGIDADPLGPFSKSLTTWSIFNDGLQLDLVYNGLIQGIVDAGNSNNNCTGTGAIGNTGIASLKNGIQIFPGGFPIYRGDVLIGGVGVSGDGTSQDDMISFLGLSRAGNILNTGIGHAPKSIRAEILFPKGRELRYVTCPVAPFNNSDEQNVCDGI
jgi:uncharacterized protein GlcG (DUF336 family)